MSEHGFLQPNPALFDLEKRLAERSGPRLAHQLGEGAECNNCGDRCPGFQLHFWRKVCLNCRCGKGEHNVVEDIDHGVSYVGKIFDRPLRTRSEECKFIYGEVVEGEVVGEGITPGEEITLDWAPPGVSQSVATKYLRSLPEGHIPIQGTEGATRRKRQLEKQFPLHDVEPTNCDQLTDKEINTMSSYVDNVKKNIAGQGIVQELLRDPKHRSPSPPLPPPPMELLLGDTSSYTNISTHYTSPGSTGSSILSSPSPPPHLSPQHSHGLSNTLVIGHRDNKVWSCSGCGYEMTPGSVAIFAERAGTDRCWHPSCFRCCSCDDMLEDLLYFYSKGQLYCGRDFAQLMNIPRCGACDELIFAAEYTSAEDQLWHVKHFCCYTCDTPLAGQKYIPVDGQPYCLVCWQRDHGKVCNSCKGVIDPQGQRVSLGDDHWHATDKCFRCGVCSVSLLGGKMSRREGTLLCSSACGQELARSKKEMDKKTVIGGSMSSSTRSPALSPNISGLSFEKQRNIPTPISEINHIGTKSEKKYNKFDSTRTPQGSISPPQLSPGHLSSISSQHSNSSGSLYSDRDTQSYRDIVESHRGSPLCTQQTSIPDNNLRTTEYKPPGTGHVMRTTDYKPPGSGPDMRTADYKAPGTGHDMRTTDYKPPGSGHEMRATDYKKQEIYSNQNYTNRGGLNPLNSGSQYPSNSRDINHLDLGEKFQSNSGLSYQTKSGTQFTTSPEKRYPSTSGVPYRTSSEQKVYGYQDNDSEQHPNSMKPGYSTIV